VRAPNNGVELGRARDFDVDVAGLTGLAREGTAGELEDELPVGKVVSFVGVFDDVR
jgi:hypothetical protein